MLRVNTILFLLVLALSATAECADELDGIGLEPVVSVSGRPLALRHAGDGTGRLFIVKQAGIIAVYDGKQVLERPFLNISGRVASGGEKGLLGLAFDPDFTENGYFYVNYTFQKARRLFTRIARFHVPKNSPDEADPGSEQVLLEFEQPFGNHNGGDLHFGSDGYLYIGTGDGGSAGDPKDVARKLNNLLGKILRIDVRGNPAGGNACGAVGHYRIPGDNPFAHKSRACGEIWAYGLRNPWRWSFDRSTQDLIIADVGQGKWEEVDFQPAHSKGGEYYGWSCMEGRHRFKSNRCEVRQKPVLPVTEYQHKKGRCSITGGYVYRGPLKALQGQYVYGDYCTGEIWLAEPGEAGWSSRLWRDTDLNIASFGEDEAGNLYVVDFKGQIYRIAARSPGSD